MVMEVHCLQSGEANLSNISIIILTYNSERTIENTLNGALCVSDDVHIVDSFSTDNTAQVASKYKINFLQHAFENYSDQRNWASKNLPIKYDWELHLDADEVLSDLLISELICLQDNFPPNINGYYISRLVHFMGRPIRHGGMFPIWHLRLFRRGKGYCERRKYDQHFIVEGISEKTNGHIIDDIKMSLYEWTSRHNRWSDAEVLEVTSNLSNEEVKPRLSGSPIERKRYFRSIYNKLPFFLRPFLLFIYRYIIRLGFFDGMPGLIFFVLQTFWFRFLIDAKIYEYKIKQKIPTC